MKFLDLAIANETIKTTDIKDKQMKKINKYGKPIKFKKYMLGME